MIRGSILSLLTRTSQSSRQNLRRRAFSSSRSELIELQDEFDESYLEPHPFVVDDDRAEPWKHLLSTPARASWRASDALPTAITNKLEELLSGKKRKQLRRAHESTLLLHKELAFHRQRERKRFTGESSEVLSPTEEKRNENMRPVLYGPENTMAHAKFRFAPYYAIAKRVLSETKSLLHGLWEPKRVLDLGIGCGSTSLAASHVYPDSIEWIHGIDASATMRECAKFMLNDQENNSLPRTTFSSHLEVSSSSASNFDLALYCHTASELPHVASNLAAVAILFEKLVPGGVLVMIEPGTPDGFLSIRSARKMLLDCDGEVIAPCTHQGPCPMETNIQLKNKVFRKRKGVTEDSEEALRFGFCSFVQTMSDSDKGEKFSYLVVRKPGGTTDVSGPDVVALLEQNVRMAMGNDEMTDDEGMKLIKDVQDVEQAYRASTNDELGLELLRGKERRETFGRIIHAPKKKKGHVIVDYCAPSGIVRTSVSKAMAKAVPGIFAASRKSRWGGFWPDIDDLRHK